MPIQESKAIEVLNSEVFLEMEKSGRYHHY